MPARQTGGVAGLPITVANLCGLYLVTSATGSAAEANEIPLGSGVPAAVLRAAAAIESILSSFDKLCYLAERLPAMAAPGWGERRVRPVAIR